MVSTDKARVNHYEVLGLERGASLEEVARAFAARMRLGAMRSSFSTNAMWERVRMTRRAT